MGLRAVTAALPDRGRLWRSSSTRSSRSRSSSCSARRRCRARRSSIRRRFSSPFPARCSEDPAASVLDWLIALMLIVALALSALNAIMGCARSLHQMSVDGQFPRFFQNHNKHGVPDRAMAFNVVCSLVVDLRGRCGRDLFVLERRLPVLVPARARRLLPASQVQAERAPAGEFARVLQVHRTRDGRFLRGDLALRGHPVLEDRQHARVLPDRDGACSLADLPLYWYRDYVEDKKEAPETPMAVPTS